MKQIQLTINKRKLDCHFGLGFLGEVLDELNMSLEDLSHRLTNNPFKYVPKLVYYSSVYGLERKGQVADYSYHDVLDWIDEDGGFANPNLTKFLEAFTKSLTKNVPKQDEVKKDTKKK